MTTHVDRDRAIAALDEVWARFDDLLAGLDDADWVRPTPLPGWRVQDVVAHVVGTESMLLGEPAPDVEIGAADHVRNDIGRFNEAWVVSMAGLAPAGVLAALRDRVARRREALQATDDAAWSAEGFTPAGRDTYGRFMRIRVFDTWLHEQDVRDAVGRPGGEDGPAAELALEEMAVAMGFVVGKKAAAPPGSRVVIQLTGPVARSILVEVPSDEGARAAVVDELSGPPTAVLRLPAGVFARLAGGRVDPATQRQL
ncbi:MAG: maleylpyruvate isomerase family mycothiol-dependent enzyme, partial [Ilumatobacteraceae bacterium]